MCSKFGIEHRFCHKYSSQANIAERMNRSILAAIRAYIDTNHTLWDKHLDEIAGALRDAIHNTKGLSPHFVAFGQHKIHHGEQYKILDQLNMLDDNYVQVNYADKHNSIRPFILEQFRIAYERNSKVYNLRSHSRKFLPNMPVFVRNFTLSDASKKYSAKLAPKFIKARVLRMVGNVAVEVEDFNGKNLGIFHLKDVKS